MTITLFLQCLVFISHTGSLMQLDTRLRGYDEQENDPGQPCVYTDMTSEKMIPGSRASMRT
mgnify:FL=1